MSLLDSLSSLGADLRQSVHRWISPPAPALAPVARVRSRQGSIEMLEERRVLASFVEVEANDTQDTGTLIPNLDEADIVRATHDDWTSISGQIATAGDVDFFQFSVSGVGLAGVFFDIDAQQINDPFPRLVPGNTLNSMLTLYRMQGANWIEIGNNDDGYDFEGFVTPTIPQYVGNLVGGLLDLRAGTLLDGQSAQKILRDSSMYMELSAGQYAIGVSSVGGTSGEYELRILEDHNFTPTPPSLNSLTRACGSEPCPPVSPPAGPNLPNTNLLYLDFLGFFDRTGAQDDYFSYEFDGQLNDTANYVFTGKPSTTVPQFSPAERLAIYNIWRIVAEDLAPFNINVTTLNLTNGVFRDGESYRMMITSYNPNNFTWPSGIDEEEEFSSGFPSLMGAAAFDSWAEGGGDRWAPNPSPTRNDQFGYIFAANHNLFVDANFGTIPNSGRIVAQPVQIANDISFQFGQALGMRKFLYGGGARNNYIMQETYIAGTYIGNDGYQNTPPFIPHDLECPSGGSGSIAVDGGTWRPHDDPSGPWGQPINVFWEGGLDMPHRLTMGLNRQTWGMGRLCDFASLANPNRVQDDVARILGNNDPDEQGSGQSVSNSIQNNADDHENNPALGATNLGSLNKTTFRKGVIGSLTDVDWFRFSAGKAGQATIRADVDEYVNNLNAVLEVYDSSMNLIAMDNPANLFDAEVTFTLTRNQTYFMRVSSNGGVGELGGYNVAVIFPEPPTAIGDFATTAEETAIDIPILANDLNGDDVIDPTTVMLGQTTAGTVVYNSGTQLVTFTPILNFFGRATFTYTVANTLGDVSNTGTVSIDVTNVNDPPLAVDDAIMTQQNQSVVIPVLDNDTHPDSPINTNDPTTVTIVSNGSNGTATANANGTVTYQPNAGFFGLDTFTYTVADNNAIVSNAATVTVDVNNPPIAPVINVMTDEDTVLVIGIIDPANMPPLAHDLDGFVDPSSVTIVTGPSDGTIQQVNVLTGQVTYMPNQDFFGIDTFTYTVTDDDGAVSSIGTVNIDVMSVNDPPVAFDDVAKTDLNTPVIIPVQDNDVDVDNVIHPFSTTIVNTPQFGTAIPNLLTGDVTYSPNAGFAGLDKFTYTVYDADLAVSNVATVTVRVGDPVAISGFVYLDLNGNGVQDAGEAGLSDVMIQIDKTDAFTLSESVRTDANGFYEFSESTVELAPAGVYTITEVHPTVLHDGPETAGTGNSNAPGNPVVVGDDVFSNVVADAGDDVVDFNFGERGFRASILFLLTGGLFHASSGPGGIAVPATAIENVDLNDGGLTFIFDTGWSGVMTTAVRLNDLGGGSGGDAATAGTDAATAGTDARIEVYNENGQLLASADDNNEIARLSVVGTAGKTRYVKIIGNHPDVDISLLGGVVDTTAPKAALATFGNVYDAGGAFHNFSITYTDDVAVDSATINGLDVRVTGPGGYSQLATPLNVGSLIPAASLTVQYTVLAAGGAWDTADTGNYTISIEPNQVADTSGNQVPAGVVGAFGVAIQPVRPVGVSDVYWVYQNTSLVVAAANGPLKNDVASSGGPLGFQLAQGPQHGTLTAAANGSFTYTPQADFQGVDSFSYYVVEGSSTSQLPVSVAIQVGQIDSYSPTFNGPQVVGVQLGGTSWTSAPQSLTGGAGQLDSVPWTEANQVSVVFDQDVVIGTNDLALTGVNVDTYHAVDFSYAPGATPGTYMATWTLDRSLRADKLMLSLAETIENAAGERLDGNWSTAYSSFPSGDGVSGTDDAFHFRFNVLPGDSNGDRLVNRSDLAAIIGSLGRSAGSTGFDPRVDVNLDGRISLADLRSTLRLMPAVLPAAEPVAANPSAPLMAADTLFNRLGTGGGSTGAAATIQAATSDDAPTGATTSDQPLPDAGPAALKLRSVRRLQASAVDATLEAILSGR